MKVSCIVLTVLILVAIMAVCIMVKFATEITLQEKRRETGTLTDSSIHSIDKALGVIALDSVSNIAAERFPYLAAITRNSSNTWRFSCFASLILVKWLVTSAHCRTKGAVHRVLIHYDYATNSVRTHPILLWRLHEKYNRNHSTPKYDIAVAKLNVDFSSSEIKTSTFNDQPVSVHLEASIWKTVSTMDKKMFLTNNLEKFNVNVVASARCFESYGVELDDSLICIDLSQYDDCFTHEFGPLYAGDKVVGVLAVKPRDCDIKVAIFTNVSAYSSWILKSTHTAVIR